MSDDLMKHWGWAIFVAVVLAFDWNRKRKAAKRNRNGECGLCGANIDWYSEEIRITGIEASSYARVCPRCARFHKFADRALFGLVLTLFAIVGAVLIL